MERPHSQEANTTHHKTGANMEPSGQKKNGRPKNTWRRETEAEMSKTGYNRKELEAQPTIVSGGKESLLSYMLRRRVKRLKLS